MSAEIARAVFAMFDGGKRAVRLTGRPAEDFDIQGDGQGGQRVRPILNIIARAARERYGMSFVRLSLAQGVQWDWDAAGFSRDEREQFLKRWKAAGGDDYGATSLHASRNESPLERVFAASQAVYRLALGTTPETLRMLLFVDHAEDLIPEPAQSECSVQLVELFCDWANDPRLRAQSILLVLSGVEERIDSRVRRCFTEVRIPQPTKEDKLKFLGVLRASRVHAGATFDAGLTDDVIANLTLGTGNKGLEELFFESAKTGTSISCDRLIEQKRADVVALSEGTIIPIDTGRAKGVRLVGRTIGKPSEYLMRVAARLRTGDPNTPANLLLVGAPGTGKTDLIGKMALEAGVPIYSLLNPKASLVGETDRRSQLQMRIFDGLGGIGFADEVDKLFCMQVSQTDLDGGASAAVYAAFLTFRSNRSVRGKSAYVGTTNRPNNISTPALSRFEVVPVIQPCVEDFPAITAELASSMDRSFKFDPTDLVLIEAAQIFFEKGASPRAILSALSSSLTWSGEGLSVGLIREAAELANEIDERDRLGAEFADLLALRGTSSALFYPWYSDPTYPFPPYLSRVVNKDGSLNQENLSARLAELEGKVNV